MRKQRKWANHVLRLSTMEDGPMLVRMWRQSNLQLADRAEQHALNATSSDESMTHTLYMREFLLRALCSQEEIDRRLTALGHKLLAKAAG